MNNILTPPAGNAYVTLRARARIWGLQLSFVQPLEPPDLDDLRIWVTRDELRRIVQVWAIAHATRRCAIG